MNKSELITRLSKKNPTLDYKQVELSVNTLLEHISSTLEKGNRVEIRGFGSYNIKKRNPRNSRNPKTGIRLLTVEKTVARFRPAKELRERIDDQREKYKIT